MKNPIYVGFLVFVSNIFASAIIINFTNDTPKIISPENYSFMEYVKELILNILIAPYVETWILYFGVIFSRKIIANENVFFLIGALPLIMIHGLSGLSKIFAIAPGFFIQAYYMRLAISNNIKTVNCIFYIFLIHAFNNGLAFGLILFFYVFDYFKAILL
jgi:hypothetical protein